MIDKIKLKNNFWNDNEFVGVALANIVSKLNELIDASNEQEKKIDFIMENTRPSAKIECKDGGIELKVTTLKDIYNQ